MKKGFTIVELAIVLVVIGIVLSMALKGKQLVEAAKMKSEVAKVHKIQNALAIYMAKKNMMYFNDFFNPNLVVGFQGINMDIFVQAGLLNAKDAQTELLSTTRASHYGLGIFGCARNKISDEVSVWDAGAKTMSNVCLTSTYLWSGSSTGAYVDTVSPRFVCAIETILDDRNEVGGMGMAWSSASYVLGLTDDDYDDCIDLSNILVTGKYYFYGLM